VDTSSYLKTKNRGFFFCYLFDFGGFYFYHGKQLTDARLLGILKDPELGGAEHKTIIVMKLHLLKDKNVGNFRSAVFTEHTVF
jgi:hypothetical protein